MAYESGDTPTDEALRAAILRAFRTAGLELVDDPHRFLAFVMDLADEDARDLMVLVRNCDADLMAPYQLAARERTAEQIQTAYSMARQILQDSKVGRGLDKTLSGRIAAQIALAMSDYLGLGEPRVLVEALRETPRDESREAATAAGRQGVEGRRVRVVEPVAVRGSTGGSSAGSGGYGAGGSSSGNTYAVGSGTGGYATGSSGAGSVGYVAGRSGSSSGGPYAGGSGSAPGSYGASGYGSASGGPYPGSSSYGSYGSSPSSSGVGPAQGGSSTYDTPAPAPTGAAQGRPWLRGLLVALVLVAAAAGAVMALRLVGTSSGAESTGVSVADQIEVEGRGHIAQGESNAEDVYLAMFELTNGADEAADVTVEYSFVDASGNELAEASEEVGVLAPGESKFVSWQSDQSGIAEGRLKAVAASTTSHTSLADALAWEETSRSEGEMVLTVTNGGDRAAHISHATVYGKASEGTSELAAIWSPGSVDGAYRFDMAPGEQVQVSFESSWAKVDFDYDAYFYGYVE